MVQLALLIILFSMCAVIYRLNDRDPLSPAFLFTAGFALCAFSTVCFSGRWAYEMLPEAFFVVVSGVIIFVAISYLVHLLNDKKRERSCGRCAKNWELPVNRVLLFALVLLEAVVLCWSMVEIASAFPADSFAGSIGKYNSAIKFTDEGADIFRAPLSQLRSFSGMVGYVFAFYIAQSFVLKKSYGRTIQIFGLLIACLLQLASASRTVAVGYLCCFAIAYFMIKSKLVHGRPVINMRTVFVLALVAMIFIVSFQPIAAIVQGRTTSSDPLGYLSSYIGAQLPNLDTFIRAEVEPEDNGIFGYMTFRNTIRWIGVQFGIPEFVYQYDLPFNTMNGVSTGNVYTTFYAFLYDFGMVGCIFLTAFMAVLSQLVYQKSRAFDSGILSAFWVILYAMVGYALILCFFSNKFYEGIFTIGMAYKIVYLLIVFWLISFFSPRKSAIKQIGGRIWQA